MNRRGLLTRRLLETMDLLSGRVGVAGRQTGRFSVAQFIRWARSSNESLGKASESTLRRDLDVLVEAGFLEVERAGADSGKFYSFIRQLRLNLRNGESGDEIRELEIAAGRKLLGSVENEAGGQFPASSPLAIFGLDATPKIPRKALGVVLAALEKGRRIRIDYAAGGERLVERTLEPWALWWIRGMLYLVAVEPADPKALPKLYRLDRVRRVETAPGVIRRPADHKLLERMRRAAFGVVSGKPERVRFAFDPALERHFADRRYHPTQRREGEQSNGRGILRLDVSPTLELEAWILSFGELVEVLEPLSLRLRIDERIRKAASNYAGG